jgi:hypothetical protein
MDVSILGGVALGADTSGYFRMSPNGSAVKRDDRYFALDSGNGNLIDVTEVSFDSPFVRLPTAISRLRPKKDIIITADNPVKAMFVLDITETTVVGIDVRTSERVDYLPSESLFFKGRFVIKVTGILDSEGHDALPFLLLSSQAASSGNDVVRQLLLLRTLRDKSTSLDDLLPLLLLGGGTAGGLNNDLVSQMLMLRSLKDVKEKKQEKERTSELDDLLPLLLLMGNQQPVAGVQPVASSQGAMSSDPFRSFLLGSSGRA